MLETLQSFLCMVSRIAGDEIDFELFEVSTFFFDISTNKGEAYSKIDGIKPK